MPFVAILAQSHGSEEQAAIGLASASSALEDFMEDEEEEEEETGPINMEDEDDGVGSYVCKPGSECRLLQECKARQR